MGSPIPETLPNQIKEKLAAYGSLRNFAIEHGIDISTVYGMFLNGGSERKGLKNLVKCAKVLEVKASDIIDIIHIEDKNTRKYRIGQLLTTAGITNMSELDLLAGVPQSTFHGFVIARRGLKLLDRCEYVSKKLGMTLEEFSEIPEKK